MTATKSKARSKTTGKKKTASKAAGRKKTTAGKSGKKTTGRSTAKKTAGKKSGAKKTQRKSKSRHADVVTMQEPADLVDMMQVSEFPAADAKLDQVFGNGMKKKTPGKKRKTDFAAWSLNTDSDPKHVGLAIRGHVSQHYRAAREHLSRVPRPVTLFVCFLGGFVFGFIARGL